ncbi:MAG: DHH family phosphoesterase [Nanoarchaeota archaeon]|nr:DHH family phosphoesterase [Nanoarchaeota archaeon]
MADKIKRYKKRIKKEKQNEVGQVKKVLLMNPYEQFNEGLKKAAEAFKKIDKKEVIRVVSHLDADGISAASIIIRLLNNDNRKYSLSIIQQLNKTVLSQLAAESYDCFIFTDIGSGVVNDIKQLLDDKKVFILDHHSIEETQHASELPAIDMASESLREPRMSLRDEREQGVVRRVREPHSPATSVLARNSGSQTSRIELAHNSGDFGSIVFVNPHTYGIDGGKEISGAGVVFKFACAVDKSMEELAHIAIIGAIGDLQDNNGFLQLNNEILEIAIKKGKIQVKKGLRIFGSQTKPLHKALEYCTDPYIPGVSGSESGAIQFLYQIGIEPKNGNDWKKIVHLDDEDMKKLVTGIIMKRLNESNPDDVLGNIYILTNEEEESPTRDAKEFATLLNACGRLGRASYGIGACLGDKKIKQQAIRSLGDYKKEIVNALNWYNENKFSDDVYWGNRFVIINAKQNVMSTMVGTLASILSKSNLMTNNTFILSMAQALDGNTKISLRAINNINGNLDLRKIIEEIIDGIGNSESGGHQNASGAVIPTDKEAEFLEAAKEVLGKYALEEKVN